MIKTPDPCLTHGVCNQRREQGRACPQRHVTLVRNVSTTNTPNPAVVTRVKHVVAQGAQVRHVGNVHAIHPHLHARDDAWLTTPGQLERTDDEREGRVLTVYDALGTTGQVVALLLTIIIVGISSGYVATRWGDDIGHYVYQALLAWGRVWT